MTDDKKRLGQFFTVDDRVQDVISELVADPCGVTLEPSAGAGHLMKLVKDREGIALHGFELDDTLPLCDDALSVSYGDFFQLSEHSDGHYDTILGNPPYVAWKNTTSSTKQAAVSTFSAYSEKANLYYLFLDRCIDLLKSGGQMVMIVPKEWLYTTSAAPLRRKMMDRGAITHLVDVGEAKVFPDASVPALVIFRYLKSTQNAVDASETISFKKWDALEEPWQEKRLSFSGGYLSLAENRYGYTVSDFFDVKVGMVSGADRIFDVTEHPDLPSFQSEGHVVDMLTTKGVRQYLFIDTSLSFEEIGESTAGYLRGHREALLHRGIRKFSEDDWWHWGAVRNIERMRDGSPRFYAYQRTRREQVFFLSDVDFYSGGVLALFPKSELSQERQDQVMRYLNSREFRQSCEDMGLTTGNKVSLQPSTVAHIPMPDVLSL